MVTVAVVIPTRNMADTLWVALGSACRGGADEIVVIDDASDDHTAIVVGIWQERYPQVRYIRHDIKLPDHNAAQRDVYASLKSDYILALAADDFLYTNCIHEIRQAASNGPAAVFTGVDVYLNGEIYIQTNISPLEGDVSPSLVSSTFRSDVNPTETGIGSAIRRDISQWLWHLGWDRLGPFMDSVGYGTAACLFGAHYVRKRCAGLSWRESSYGRTAIRTAEDFQRLADISMDFMISAGLDLETSSALQKKRCVI